MKLLLTILIFIISIIGLRAQTGVGIGIYPTGTETGIGFRSSKNSKWILDARITKANLYSNKTQSSFITEVGGTCRLIRLEKVRFHLGIGVRNEWNIAGKRNKVGLVVPGEWRLFLFHSKMQDCFLKQRLFIQMTLSMVIMQESEL